MVPADQPTERVRWRSRSGPSRDITAVTRVGKVECRRVGQHRGDNPPQVSPRLVGFGKGGLKLQVGPFFVFDNYRGTVRLDFRSAVKPSQPQPAAGAPRPWLSTRL